MLQNMTTFAPRKKSVRVAPNVKSASLGSMDIVTFLNENWNTVVSMMLGIRNAVLSFSENDVLTHEHFRSKFCYQLVHKRTKASVEKVRSCRER